MIRCCFRCGRSVARLVTRATEAASFAKERTGIGRSSPGESSIPRRFTRVSELKLGIPKGSLETATIELFRKSGWKISTSSRSYFPSIDDGELRCTLVRAQEMSRYVEMGTLDTGITGKDWTQENGSDVHVVTDLVYSKVSSRPVRWVLAVPHDSPIKKIEDLKGKRIAHRDAWQDSWKRGKIEQIQLLLQGALAAENKVGIKLNVAEADLEKVIQLIPSITAPTIATLYQSAALRGVKWFSIESVIAENVVRDLIPQLIQNGAVGIIEYPLNKII